MEYSNKNISRFISIYNTYFGAEYTRTIYVETTGNDQNGKGTPDKPFLTLEKALSTIKRNLGGNAVTIQFGLGDFDFTPLCRGFLDSFYGGRIYFKGTLVVESENVAFTKDGTQPFKNTVTIDSIAPTWSLDEVTGKYAALNEGDLLPIAYSINDEAYLTAIGSHYKVFNQIVSLGTNVIMKVGELGGISIQFRGYNITFINNSGYYIRPIGSCDIKYCSFKNSITTDNALIYTTPSATYLVFRHCHFELTYSSGWYMLNSAMALEQCAITIKSGHTVSQMFKPFGENSLTLTEGVINLPGTILYKNTAGLCDLISEDSMCIYQANSLIGTTEKCWRNSVTLGCLYSPNSLKLFTNDQQDLVNVSVVIENIIGNLTQNILNYVDPGKKINIYMPKVFPEYSTGVRGIASDNGTTDVSIGNITQNRSIKTDYSVERDGKFKIGTINLLNDTSTLILTADASSQTADIGLSLSSQINGDNIELKLTLTSTGHDADYKLNVGRIMI